MTSSPAKAVPADDVEPVQKVGRMSRLVPLSTGSEADNFSRTLTPIAELLQDPLAIETVGITFP